jgi:putative oxidoreductase
VTAQSPDPGWQRPEDAPARPASARVVDPEEDVGSAGYAGGDLETTRIPPLGVSPSPLIAASPSSADSAGFGVLGEPEALPYAPAPPVAAGPVEIAPGDAEIRAAGRRGTQDLGLLVLRAALGAVLISHGLQKAFGWWGGDGLEGFRATLTEAGYQHAGLLTYLGAGAQIAAGVLLVLGLFTPLAAAGALALLVNGVLIAAETQRREGALFLFGPGGLEGPLVLTALAAAIVLAGPGRYGFDAGRGWARRPFVGSLLALLAGAGGGVALWFFLNGANPLA